MLRRPIESAQFRSHAYLRTLRRAQLRGSMGRVGACADDAAIESSSSLVQENVLNRQRWQNREELRPVIVVWIEKTYGPERDGRLSWLLRRGDTCLEDTARHEHLDRGRYAAGPMKRVRGLGQQHAHRCARPSDPDVQGLDRGSVVAVHHGQQRR